jgi:hypothetical protein
MSKESFTIIELSRQKERIIDKNVLCLRKPPPLSSD